MKKHSPWLIVLMIAPGASLVTSVAWQGNQAFAMGDEPADVEVVEDESVPLSVAPLDHVEYPEHRPDWVEPSVTVDDQATTIVVVSGPTDSLDESLKEMVLIRRAALETFITEVTGDADAVTIYRLSDEEIDRELVTRRYEGEVSQGGSTKYEHAVEIRLDNNRREEILASLDSIEVRDRLSAIGVLTVGGLVTLMGSSALLGVVLRRSNKPDLETESRE